MLARNELPNLEKLRKTGCYLRVQTTYPAQTPVAWSSFATGDESRGAWNLRFHQPRPANQSAGSCSHPFRAAKEHFQSAAYRQSSSRHPRLGSASHRRRAEHGAAVSLYFSAGCKRRQNSCRRRGPGPPGRPGNRNLLHSGQDGSSARIRAPHLLWSPGTILSRRRSDPVIQGRHKARISLANCEYDVDPKSRSLRFETGGSPAIEIPERTWGPWMRVNFKVSMLQTISGIVRFFVCQVSPWVEFYASPVNFDPASPFFPISAPPGYAKDLADQAWTLFDSGNGGGPQRA